VAASSGQASQFMAITNIAGAGDNIVSTSYLYGGVSTSLGSRENSPLLIRTSRRTINSKVDSFSLTD
jgi:O-acetylhomoserine/O-acetylserine sulfhydrylase-like pyridoxal-dependent enzyme